MDRETILECPSPLLCGEELICDGVVDYAGTETFPYSQANTDADKADAVDEVGGPVDGVTIGKRHYL